MEDYFGGLGDEDKKTNRDEAIKIRGRYSLSLRNPTYSFLSFSFLKEKPRSVSPTELNTLDLEQHGKAEKSRGHNGDSVVGGLGKLKHDNHLYSPT